MPIMKSNPSSSTVAYCVLGVVAAAGAVAARCSAPHYSLSREPASPISQPLGPQFVSYSFEPAFWIEFFGEPDSPRNLTFTLLNHLHERGARPIIRAGGITMDSMVFDGRQKASVVRTEDGKGGIYRTTVGPAFYRQWDTFPPGTRFVSTLNFGNASLDIARGLAAASYQLQRDKIAYYELGNEPTNYPSSRWNGSTAAYIAQWQHFTGEIDAATHNDSHGRWWASSATTDITPLRVRPSDLIPAGVNSTGQVGQYSIHSYAFATCDPARAARATIANLLNHTLVLHYVDTEILPSAQAAMAAGAGWIIGEFNSVACSGKPGVSDTFAQALWAAAASLAYAARNASAVHAHQGAALRFQSDQQLNAPGDDGSPGFSSYSLLYPVDSSKRGEARVLPVFVSQLLLAEALIDDGNGGVVGGYRIAALDTPEGLSQDGFAAYGIFGGAAAGGLKLAKMVILNTKPYYAGQDAARGTVSLDIGKHKGAAVKRMTAPSVDETDTAKVTWAGQSFRNGNAVGHVSVERLRARERVLLRDSEAVLVTFEE
ncbi:uncharacterized protein B0T15DRAFT_530686 [Chaetomium strumarium]|uniref:Beta-glucuronidase C-terminal domain-containing protein n=1 Tax=Chaetomium strumarium TaxID=1170767 RepID=A0AAJ0GWU8_9PEZI|nr:hypothetical protein B0T15DRAFT_530686 [Chaetomium strumarium]